MAAGKTLISGTAYTIKGGKALVGGTAYSIKKGKTLISGTSYNIIFKPPFTVIDGKNLGDRVDIVYKPLGEYTKTTTWPDEHSVIGWAYAGRAGISSSGTTKYLDTYITVPLDIDDLKSIDIRWYITTSAEGKPGFQSLRSYIAYADDPTWVVSNAINGKNEFNGNIPITADMGGSNGTFVIRNEYKFDASTSFIHRMDISKLVLNFE